MYNNISLCFILLFGGSMIRSVDPQHTTKELAIMKAFMDKDFLLETPPRSTCIMIMQKRCLS